MNGIPDPGGASKAVAIVTASAIDLTTPHARTHRDGLAERTDVLDKVGVLRCLPDDMHVTTTEAARFYEVDVELIRYHLKANRDELESDGYRVIGRSEFESEFDSLSNLDPRARSIGLFPRRAVLRLGMLLRDSPVARRVRDYLLDAERSAGFAIPRTLPDALRAYAAEVEAHDLVKAQREAERPLVERAKTHAAGTGAKTRQQFFREVKQWAQDTHGITVKQAHVMTFLSTSKLGLFIGGNRTDTGNATSWAIEKGYARSPEGTAENGHNFVRPVLTPSGQEYAWDRCIRYIELNGTLEIPRQIGGAA
ncbi:phage antirepressor KilAC domain-containing protein [Mycolicibacterium sp. A43C]